MSHSPHNPLAWIEPELATLERRQLRRGLVTHRGPQRACLEVGGRELINFGSNDYLGLAADPRVASAAAEASRQCGAGSGASPLVTGHAEAHQRLEHDLAAFAATGAALVFGSGYAANLGTIASLAGAADAIYSDQKNHASIIDGCRLSRATVHVYPHRDWRALESLLSNGSRYRRRLIVTESVFSMDGDVAPLVELAELAEHVDAMLMVDEAHATGVFGAEGRGVAEQLGVADRVHIHVGTLSKALGSSGGFVVGSRPLIEWLVNRARSYVFSTAPAPAVCAAASAALAIVRSEPERRSQLADRAAQLRQRLRNQGWNTGDSASQIIPLVVGEAHEAVRISAALRQSGLLVPAIRPPSVPPDESLLRVSLAAAHTDEMIDRLAAALAPLAAPAVAARTAP